MILTGLTGWYAVSKGNKEKKQDDFALWVTVAFKERVGYNNAMGQYRDVNKRQTGIDRPFAGGFLSYIKV